MTAYSIAPHFTNHALSNSVLRYDIITCINSNEDIKMGESFHILGEDDGKLSVMFRGKKIGICTKEMSYRNGGAKAYFKPRVVISSIDTLVVRDVGVVTTSSSSESSTSQNSGEYFCIKDALIAINGLNMEIGFEKTLLADGSTSYRFNKSYPTNIFGDAPLLETTDDVQQQIVISILESHKHKLSSDQ